MTDYQTAIKLALKDCQQMLPRISNKNRDDLFSLVRKSNKDIVAAFIDTFPQSSLLNVVDYYLNNYKYFCIRSERHSITNRYSIKVGVATLPFSSIIEKFPSFFSFSREVQLLNDILFYAIIEKDQPYMKQKELAEELSKLLGKNYNKLSINFLQQALYKYLFLISGGDDAFSRIYSKKRNIRLIFDGIIWRRCKNISDMDKLYELAVSKKVPADNVLCVLMDSLVRERENSEELNRNITRHPAWCYNNLSGNGLCSELGIECHSTIGCPFFQKAKKLPSGAIKLDLD